MKSLTDLSGQLVGSCGEGHSVNCEWWHRNKYTSTACRPVCDVRRHRRMMTVKRGVQKSKKKDKQQEKTKCIKLKLRQKERKKTTRSIKKGERKRKETRKTRNKADLCKAAHIHDDHFRWPVFSKSENSKAATKSRKLRLLTPPRVCPHYVTTFKLPNGFSWNLTPKFSVLNICAHIPISVTIGHQCWALNKDPTPQSAINTGH